MQYNRTDPCLTQITLPLSFQFNSFLCSVLFLGAFYMKPTCVGLTSSRSFTILNGSRYITLYSQLSLLSLLSLLSPLALIHSLLLSLFISLYKLYLKFFPLPYPLCPLFSPLVLLPFSLSSLCHSKTM